jgi:hypothetical protein
MGYSMRTSAYRYTAYYPFNRTTLLPGVLGVLGVHAGALPYEEELFDHRNETLAASIHRELINLAHRPPFETIVHRLRKKLKEFVRRQFRK